MTTEADDCIPFSSVQDNVNVNVYRGGSASLESSRLCVMEVVAFVVIVTMMAVRATISNATNSLSTDHTALPEEGKLTVPTSKSF